MRQNMAERKSFEAQALPHIDGLYSTALCVLGDEFKAQDLVLETFTKAFRSWPDWQFSPNLRVSLFTIMLSVLIYKYPHSAYQSVAMNDTDEIDEYLAYPRQANQQSIDDFGCDYFSKISEYDVRKAFRNLPDVHRLMMALFLLGDFSYREIADIAGIDLENVSSKLYQGHELIQVDLLAMRSAKLIKSCIDSQSMEKKSSK